MDRRQQADIDRQFRKLTKTQKDAAADAAVGMAGARLVFATLIVTGGAVIATAVTGNWAWLGAAFGVLMIFFAVTLYVSAKATARQAVADAAAQDKA